MLEATQNKKSFLMGALLLTGANLLSQFLGLFSKLAILWLIGEEGVGIYNYPYAFYAILLSFSSVGFNVAISKLVAERNVQGKYAQSLSIFRCSLKLMIAFGLIATLLLVVLAWPLALFAHRDPRALWAYLALAPAALLSSWQAAYRGFFQGTQNMYPNALSQIVEQVCRIIAMLSFAALLIPHGLEWGAVGAVLGAAVGAVGSYLFLASLFRRALHLAPWKQAQATEARNDNPSNRKLYDEIMHYAIPISFAGIGLPLFLLADSLLITNRLQAFGYELSVATAAYGALSNNAMSLISLPTVLSSSLFVSLVPALSEARTREDSEGVLLQSRSALKISLLLALPAAAGMYLVAEPLCAVIGMGGLTAEALKTLVFGLPFLVLQQVTAGALQGLGKAREPVVTMLLGALLKATITWLSTGPLGLTGAAWGTNCGFALAALCNLWILLQEVGPVLDFDRAVFRPLLSTALMATAILTWRAFEPDGLSNAVQLTVIVFLGVTFYLLGLVMFRALTEEDLRFLPLKGALRRILVRS